MTHTLYRNFIARWFGNVNRVLISESGLTLVDVNQKTKEISIDQLIDFPRIKTSILGPSLIIKTKAGDSRIWGINTNCAKSFAEEAELMLNKSISSNITRHIDHFHQTAISQYLRDSSIQHLSESVTPIIQSFKASKGRWRNILSAQQLAKIDVISRMPDINNAQSFRQYYENNKLTDHANFFDSIESNPLTHEQRLAVIRNNDKNLILAAAGTGKTSVMVAKSLSLITHDNVPADNVLVLAYNNAAAKELKERLAVRKQACGLTCETPSIMTFHALGLHILKTTEENTQLSSFAEDPMQLESWFTQWFITHICQNPATMSHFISLAYQPFDVYELTDTETYEAHVRDNEYQTLQGEKVTSYQELQIANWLFLHSVDYVYHGKYVTKRRITAGVDYKAAFTLINKSSPINNNVYLECFELTRDGCTRVGVDAKQYHDEIDAIRALHQECETQLLETFYFDYSENNLDNRLTGLMAQSEISLVPKNTKSILSALQDTGLLTENIKRYLKCLQAIRVEQLTSEQVESRLNHAQVANAKYYVQLLSEIVTAYEEELTRQQAIDFDDMITKAFSQVSSGHFIPQWTDILVDEFQDISSARMNLLNELINKGPKPKITAVGDDWQSIYRFSGGKLALITQFEKYNGSHSLTTLQKTFRYNNSIAGTAGRFVMQNPEQYKKQIKAHHQVTESQVFLLDSEKNAIDERVAQVVKRIEANDPNGSIAILARYRYLLDNAKTEIMCITNNKNINYWTFHGAKGLEADYCIILGFFRGKTGFPNNSKEDVIVEALLPLADDFENSEERRLFYVAVTRAKKKVYLLADTKEPSPFIEELLSSNYDLQITSNKFNKLNRESLKCPACISGYLSLNSGKYGDFYACSSQGACNIKPRICVKCSSPSVDNKSQSLCQNPKCKETLKICSKCGRAMKLRKGQYSDFWGCNGFANKTDQCTHTEKAELSKE